MVLGYNGKRPTEENYRQFERSFVDGLKNLAIDRLSLMLYGSYVRGDFNPGRSDIDAVLIFPGDVVIDKERLASVSHLLSDSLQHDFVPFQVTVSDLQTMQDGRFNSYEPSFGQYFCKEGKVVVGPDYREAFRFEFPTFDGQVPIRFNLRKARMGLLFAEHDLHNDYQEFLRRLNRTLDAASRGSKQILYLMNGHLEGNRFSARHALPEIMPEVDFETLERIRTLYLNPSLLDKIYHSPPEALALMQSAVTLYESLIKGYLDRTPHP